MSNVYSHTRNYILLLILINPKLSETLQLNSKNVNSNLIHLFSIFP